ncbi:right-handed parallel beta-helix repeat-containing protein [Sphingomonas sp. Leaf38]|uniref:right-handed parallel beta-helix repeat-containing protein n=1 Tax=Sphingomonas sp. Leaf38 TaxID=1736217 RepID=UPI0006F2AE9D|nr:right-handed parallel beta-helix repeat-containing protein [Sphingomonas sp. Leaf38]KQN33626.1 hypothetical protein ASE88_00915 [Sphingomonas sp. Leaf38]
MSIPAILDRNQDVRVIRGAAFRLVMKIKRKDGALVDLTGMSFRWSVFDARSTMFADIRATGAGNEVAFPMTGTQSAALVGIGLKHQVDQIVENGFAPWLAGSFTTSVGPSAAVGAGPSSDILAEVGESSGIVIVSAAGAAGITPWEAAGISFAAYDAQLRAPAVEAAAQAGADVDAKLASVDGILGAKADNLIAPYGGTARTAQQRAADVVHSADIAGIDPSGVADSTDGLIDLFERASNAGKPAIVGPGRYRVANRGPALGGVYAMLAASLFVQCDPKAYIFADNLDHDLIRFSVPSTGVESPIKITWIGGTIDQSNQKVSTTVPFIGSIPPVNPGVSGTTDGISLKMLDASGNPCCEFLRIIGTTFTAGTHWQVAGGDAAIFPGSGIKGFAIVDCEFYGSRDTAIYTSDDGTPIVGEGGTVENCKFVNCVEGIAFKRNYNKFSVIRNKFTNCVVGVRTNRVSGGQLFAGDVSGNTFDKCTIGIRLQYSLYVSVMNNRHINLGCTGATGAAYSPYNFLAPVWFEGSQYCKWSGDTGASINPPHSAGSATGAYLEDYTPSDMPNGFPSLFNEITNITIIGLKRLFLETGATDFTICTGCVEHGTTAPPTIVGAHTIYAKLDLATGQRTLGALLLADGTDDVPSIGSAIRPTVGWRLKPTGAAYGSSGTTYFEVFTDGSPTMSARPISTNIGSAALPAHTFNNDLTTGMYRPGTARVAFAAAGVSVMEASTSAFKTPFGRIRAYREISASGAVSIATADDLVVIRKTAGEATTCTLPSLDQQGRRVTIKDGKGDANLRPITIVVSGGGLIDGRTSTTIAAAYGSRTLFFDGVQWNVEATGLASRATIATSAVAAGTTGSTSEVTLATIAIPALGPNDAVEVITNWSFTGSTNTKTLRVRWGQSWLNFAASGATTVRMDDVRRIQNRGSTSSQVGHANASTSPGTGTGTANQAVGVLETSVATTMTITATLAVGTETATLESYRVEIVRAP